MRGSRWMGIGGVCYAHWGAQAATMGVSFYANIFLLAIDPAVNFFSVGPDVITGAALVGAATLGCMDAERRHKKRQDEIFKKAKEKETEYEIKDLEKDIKELDKKIKSETERLAKGLCFDTVVF